MYTYLQTFDSRFPLTQDEKKNHIRNYYKNTIIYKVKVNAEEVLSTNVKNSLIISCFINRREVKYLTYNSILSNICLLYNISIESTPLNNNAEVLRKIIELIKVYNISLDIIIKLQDYKVIQYCNYYK